MKRFYSLLVFLILIVISLNAEVRMGRPFILTSERQALIQREWKEGNNPRFNYFLEQIMAEAEWLQIKEPAKRELIGPRLLGKSRQAVFTISYSALAWALTGEERFYHRALKEMQDIAEFIDWNPSHFLDTAELSAAMAIGLNWLETPLRQENSAEWNRLADVLIEKGINPAFAFSLSANNWTKGKNNWNQVCSAGLLLAAMAIENYQPKIAQKMRSLCLALLSKILWCYEPDGSYPEGVGYWDYGTFYHLIALDALFTQEGEIPKALVSPQLMKSYQAVLKSIDSNYMTFNYGDAGARVCFNNLATALLWLANFNGDKEAQATIFNLAKEEGNRWSMVESGQVESSLRRPEFIEPHHYQRNYCLNLFYSVSEIANQLAEEGKKFQDPNFKESGIVSDDGDLTLWRGNQSYFVWKKSTKANCEDEIFVAGKGGRPINSHASMDVGSFVLYKYGIRWVADLGGDDYNLPLYWSNGQWGGRWRIFRHQPASHNLLRFRKGEQKVSGLSVGMIENEKVVFDLSDLWRLPNLEYTRSFDLQNQNLLFVEDQFEGAITYPIWQIVTEATARVEERQIVLEKEGKVCRILLTDSEGQTLPNLNWSVSPATPKRPLKGEQLNEGFSIVQCRIPFFKGTVKAKFEFVN